MGSFADQLAAFEVKVTGAADAVVSGSIIELGDRVIDRTPIKSGRAKSNYNYSLETPDPHTTFATDIRKLNGIEDMPAKAAGFVHFISNGLAYAPALERGSSTQAPSGMVGISALEWPEIVESVALRVVG